VETVAKAQMCCPDRVSIRVRLHVGPAGGGWAHQDRWCASHLGRVERRAHLQRQSAEGSAWWRPVTAVLPNWSRSG